MLTSLLEVCAGLVNLCLGDGVDRQTVERLLQVFHIVSQLCVGRYNHIAHQCLQHLAQILLLLFAEFGSGDGRAGSLQFGNQAHAVVDGILTKLLFAVVVGCGVGSVVVLIHLRIGHDHAKLIVVVLFVVVTVAAAGSEGKSHHQDSH